MAESTLSGTRTEIRRHVGRYLTLNRDPTQWTSENSTDVADILKSGERQFYGAYPWRFLRPTLELDIDNGEADYALPDDFGGFIDTWLSFTCSNNAVHPVRHTGVAEVLRLRMNEQAAIGKPEVFAIQWARSLQTSGQRAELWLYPTPSENASLIGPYYSLPNAISDSATYPLGGMPYFECLLESCLAQAELFMNDAQDIHRQQYQVLLAQAIAHERRTGAANLGYNGDRSTQRVLLPRIRSEYVTYNGQSLV